MRGRFRPGRMRGPMRPLGPVRPMMPMHPMRRRWFRPGCGCLTLPLLAVGMLMLAAMARLL